VHYRGGNRAHYNSARSADGSIVSTIAEFFVWTKKSEAGSKVATIALRPIETKVPRSGRRYNGSAHKQTEGTITVNAQERDAVKLLF
jgi:hypothetical protein